MAERCKSELRRIARWQHVISVSYVELRDGRKLDKR